METVIFSFLFVFSSTVVESTKVSQPVGRSGRAVDDATAAATIRTCLGQNVTFPGRPNHDLSQLTNPKNGLLSVELIKSDGDTETLLAVNTSGHFFPVSGTKRAPEFVPNKGIQLSGVTRADLGQYKIRSSASVDGVCSEQTETVILIQQDDLQIDGGQLKTYIRDDLIYDTATQQWHVQLVCGRFILSKDDASVSLQWRTPSGQLLNSTTSENGDFVLHVPNPVQHGHYACVITTNKCWNSIAVSGTVGTVQVNSAEQRLRVLEASVSALQTDLRMSRAEATEHLRQLALSLKQQCCPGSVDQGVLRDGVYTLAFRLTPYIGQSAYDVYTKIGHDDDDPLVRATMPPGCLSMDGRQRCDRHYRSHILDVWQHLPIEKVRVAVYQNGSEQAFFEFDGTGTNSISWFNKDRLLNTSSYLDVFAETKNYCNIAGSGVHRRFFINNIYGGCANDVGWMVVTDAPEGCRPTWGPDPPYPVISYMQSETKQKWASEYVRHADVLAIWVKIAVNNIQN